MAKVHITNVVVLDNPSSFLNPFQFELTFECIEELKEDLEWKMIYVGSAESEDFDQVLDTIYVGPVPEGRHIFVFQADPPNVARIPEQDAVGVTVVLLTCSYRGQEFVRVGYFINNEYSDQELRENPPAKPLFHQMTRNILASKPRVTRFKINWDDTPAGAANGAGGTGMEEDTGMIDDGSGLDGQMNPGTSSSALGIGSSSSSAAAAAGMMGQQDDSSSMAMPREFNENSNSLAMEC